MNNLRDVWRIKWQTTEREYGPGYLYEGFWVTTYETSARMAAHDALLWIVRSRTTWDSDSYPMEREVSVYTMDNGSPREVARVKAVKAAPDAPFMLPCELEAKPEMLPEGKVLETYADWSRAYGDEGELNVSIRNGNAG